MSAAVPSGSQDVDDKLIKVAELVTAIERNVASLGTPKDAPALRRKIQTDRLQANKMIELINEWVLSQRDSMIGRPAAQRAGFDYVQQKVGDFRRVLDAARTREASATVRFADPEQSTGLAKVPPSIIQQQQQRALDTTVLSTEAQIQREKNAAIQDVCQNIAELRELTEDCRDLIMEQRADVNAISNNTSRAAHAVDVGVSNIQAVRPCPQATQSPRPPTAFVSALIPAMALAVYDVCVSYLSMSFICICTISVPLPPTSGPSPPIVQQEVPMRPRDCHRGCATDPYPNWGNHLRLLNQFCVLISSSMPPPWKLGSRAVVVHCPSCPPHVVLRRCFDTFLMPRWYVVLYHTTVVDVGPISAPCHLRVRGPDDRRPWPAASYALV